jgi:hypothetical protein
MSKRITLARHARKAPAAPPPPNRHQRRSPIDGAALFTALAEIKAGIDLVLAELRRKP